MNDRMISLRHFSREDAESIRGNLYPDMTITDIMDMIDAWNSQLFHGHYFEMFAIVSGGQIAGSASLSERTRSIVSAGVEVYHHERGKGFGSEAVSLLLQYASEKGYRVMLNQVRKDNSASIRLHEKLGFETDGYVYRNQRNHEVVLYLKLL